MRTTVEIPNDLFHQIKRRADEEGVTIQDFLVQAAKRELQRDASRIVFPLIPSRYPGTLQSLTNQEIDELSD